MPIGELVGADRNPKGHDTAGLGRSISRWGFADAPILDDRTGKLVAGHGRLQDLLARQASGEDPPEGVTVDKAGQWLAPVQRGWSSRSDDEAAAFLIGHNQLTTNGGWDEQDLAGMLTDLREVDAELLLAAGFDDDKLAELLAAATEVPPALDDGSGASALGDDGFAIIITCRDETQQRDLVERFESEGLVCRPLMM
jgi:hypothetical protein